MQRETGGRVIVGVEDSLAGLRALRVAVAEARRRGTALHALRAWNLNPSGQGTSRAWYDELERAAAATIVEAFDKTLGGLPGDVDVAATTVVGHPGRALVRYADRDDDTLVIGAARRHWLRRLVRPSVARYCVARAQCPVLVVPPDAFARQARREGMARSIRRGLPSLIG
ncbi:MAG TPA: universal stress protein [Dactylosporangium sp.]|nr:universal stress protein [Dactylosporangium sp.]